MSSSRPDVISSDLPALSPGRRWYCIHTDESAEADFVSFFASSSSPLVIVSDRFDEGLLTQLIAARGGIHTEQLSSSGIGFRPQVKEVPFAVRLLNQKVKAFVTPGSAPPCVLIDMAWLLSSSDCLQLVTEFETHCTEQESLERAVVIPWIDATIFPAQQLLDVLSFFPEVLLDNDIVESPESSTPHEGFADSLLERTLKALKELHTTKKLLRERSSLLLHAEAALETLNSILDSMGEGVLVTDITGKIILFNRRAEQIMGYGMLDLPIEERVRVYGNYLPDKVTPYPLESLPIVRAMRGEKVDEAEIYIKNPERPDGVWLSVTTRPLRDVVGKITGGISVFRDITSRKEPGKSSPVPSE